MSADRPTRHRRRAAAVVLAATALVVAGCGSIPSDDGPDLVASDAVPAELSEVTTTTTTTPTGDRELEALYVVYVTPDDEERLPACFVFVDRSETMQERATRLLQTLIELVPAENTDCRSAFTNAIPPGVELLGVSLQDDGVLVVDLSNLGEGSVGDGQRRAIAQIVFTATNLPGVSAVRFQKDGEDTAVAVGGGRSVKPGEAVSRADFPGFSTSPVTTTTTAPPPPEPPALLEPAPAPGEVPPVP